ncbi:ORF6N domain-containing protein [Candidatus Woesearchaeota archaeon]|nr:ORF6N domain-containing protein [Candidatus Woesearchaeota archaeon]
MKKNTMLSEQEIRSKIYTIRETQVMLDEDLARLYNVETRVLNQAVKRNTERFPQNFIFQLNEMEYKNLISQSVTSSSEWGGRRKLPYVFTEQGVAMLSTVLKSETAVKVSIKIIEAFVAMRKFLLTNAQLFQRMDRSEQKILEHDNKFEQVFSLIETKGIKPEKGIFFDGQIFDAYKFFSDVIRTANTSIVLIDNYIDDSVLTLFNKKKENVKVTIFTKEVSKHLLLDLKKYNSQYSSIEVKEFKQSHDRFIIIDNKEVYHFGASLKDLGKKWFAFSKFDKEAFMLLDKLK